MIFDPWHVLLLVEIFILRRFAFEVGDPRKKRFQFLRIAIGLWKQVVLNFHTIFPMPSVAASLGAPCHSAEASVASAADSPSGASHLGPAQVPDSGDCDCSSRS